MESYPEKSIAAAGKWLECVPKGSCVEVNSHNSNTEVLTKKHFFLETRSYVVEADLKFAVCLRMTLDS